MTNCRRGDIVLVPFPYTDRTVRIRRPTLVVSAQPLGLEKHHVVWVLMITSAENARWPGDILVNDLRGTGLLDPSFVRTAKIVNAELRGAEKVGVLGRSEMSDVEAEVRVALGFLNM